LVEIWLSTFLKNGTDRLHQLCHRLLHLVILRSIRKEIDRLLALIHNGAINVSLTATRKPRSAHPTMPGDLPAVKLMTMPVGVDASYVRGGDDDGPQ
jgi:hypothetical protein